MWTTHTDIGLLASQDQVKWQIHAIKFGPNLHNLVPCNMLDHYQLACLCKSVGVPDSGHSTRGLKLCMVQVVLPAV